ncbi:G-protein coupled receptor 4-like [Engraulis encrasicolus]|uniref:G-protein coupled receptor 4-like n=1 Tax=Engraulis encrasicolus TaxID=184585 RepID=UPI002FCE6C44
MNDLNFSMSIQSWAILPIGLPVVCLAIRGLLSMIKSDHVVPVYVINLLISDVLKMCGRPVVLSMAPSGWVYELVAFLYCSGMHASISFMLCIAGERYTMIVHPLWYRFHRTIKKSILCSMTVWMVTFVSLGVLVLAAVKDIIGVGTVFVSWSIFGLLPYPFALFFFVETWRALSKSISIPPREQRRIMGTLALVLIIYSASFLPNIVVTLLMSLSPWMFTDHSFQLLAQGTTALLSLNLLADPVLYVFMGKRSSASLSCCRCSRGSHQEERERTATSPPLMNTTSSSSGAT